MIRKALGVGLVLMILTVLLALSASTVMAAQGQIVDVNPPGVAAQGHITDVNPPELAAQGQIIDVNPPGMAVADIKDHLSDTAGGGAINPDAFGECLIANDC